MFCLFFIYLFFLFIYLFFFLSFLYSVIRYSLSSPPRIAMLTAGYNGLCNLTQVNKVCVCETPTSNLTESTVQRSSALKGGTFQGGGITKGRHFTSFGIEKGRENCHKLQFRYLKEPSKYLKQTS